MTNNIALLSAIFGDIIGSSYEFKPTKDINFQLITKRSTITDDTAMTIAVADWLLHGGELSSVLQKWGRKYINLGYGSLFLQWLLLDKPYPYNSFGNGSAMRVSPIGWFFNNLEDVLNYSWTSAEVTHNHPDGIKGAQAIAAAIFLARTGETKEYIKDYIECIFDYNLSQSYDDIHKNAKFDATCKISVPEAIICFLNGTDYESTVRMAVALGGDADTQAAIAGSIAGAFYKEIPDSLAAKCIDLIPDDMYEIVEKFQQRIL